MSKVFRVLISETQGFYVDIEATSPQHAMNKVRGRLGDNDVVPIEDSHAYTGYQVDDAMEIPRENCDLP